MALPAAALVGWASRKPDTFRYSRSRAIAAPPERIFPLIANLKAMNTWNPFAKTDPAMKGVYSGPDDGKGAAFDFDGNKNAGAGRCAITSSVPSSKVTMSLVMTRPFACDNVVEFGAAVETGRHDPAAVDDLVADAFIRASTTRQDRTGGGFGTEVGVAALALAFEQGLAVRDIAGAACRCRSGRTRGRHSGRARRCRRIVVSTAPRAERGERADERDHDSRTELRHPATLHLETMHGS